VSRKTSQRAEQKELLLPMYDDTTGLYDSLANLIRRLQAEEGDGVPLTASDIRNLDINQVEKLLHLATDAAQETSDVEARRKWNRLKKKLQKLLATYAAPPPPALVRRQAASLSRYTRPVRVTDKRRARAWEEANFAPPGTAYQDPATLPPPMDEAKLAAKVGLEQAKVEAIRASKRELSRRTREEAVYLTGERLQKVMDNPELRRRAIAIGLLPG
jgi:hypothetical protein